MRRLRLREHGRRENVELAPAEAATLGALVRDLTVHPTAVPNSYILEPGSTVGVIRISDLAVEIRPKIPVRRFLFLLAYSLSPDTWREELFGYRGHDSLVEAIAHGFVRACRKAVSRGLLRGYRRREEALQTVRGRIRFDAQITRHFGRGPPVEVTYDEFSEDIDENRILLAAIQALGGLHLRSDRVRRELRSLRPTFSGVSHIDYQKHHPLPGISSDRLNRHYRPAIELARLILQGASIRQRAGEVTHAAFLVDMNDLFEDFVVVALREALGLSERAFPQGARGRRLHLDEEKRVCLEPDLSWWREGRCQFVGDVKYKREQGSGGRNADLYQLLAYSVATGLPFGLLVYAEGGSEGSQHRVPRLGKRLEVRHLELTKSPDGILADIDEIAREIRSRVEATAEANGSVAAREVT